MPPGYGGTFVFGVSDLFLFAGLVGNATAGLAGRLARGLAFAATAVLGAFAQIAGSESFDSFHNYILRSDGFDGAFCLNTTMIPQWAWKVKIFNLSFFPEIIQT